MVGGAVRIVETRRRILMLLAEHDRVFGGPSKKCEVNYEVLSVRKRLGGE